MDELQKKTVNYLVKNLNSFTKQQKKCLDDFGVRFSYIYKLSNGLKELNSAGVKFRNKLDEDSSEKSIFLRDMLQSSKINNVFREFDAVKNDLLKEINEIFDNVIVQEKKDVKNEDVLFWKEENLMLKVLEVNKKRINDFSDTDKNLQGEAKKRIDLFLKEMSLEIQDEKDLEVIDEEFRKIKERFSVIISKQGETLYALTQDISQFVQVSIHSDIDEMKKVQKRIMEYRDRIFGLMKEEKELIINPFERYFRRKSFLTKKLEDLTKRGKKGISMVEIKSDLKTFTYMSEYTRYLNKIRKMLVSHVELFDNAARINWFLLGFETLLFKHADTLEQERRIFEKQANIDARTRLFDSKAIYPAVEVELKKTIRDTIFREDGFIKKQKVDGFSFIFIDIDNFKIFNDVYSHKVGDEVLELISKIIRNTIRGTDSAYRYGGDEICVLLPETSIQGGHKVAEQILENVNKGAKEYSDKLQKNAPPRNEKILKLLQSKHMNPDDYPFNIIVTLSMGVGNSFAHYYGRMNEDEILKRKNSHLVYKDAVHFINMVDIAAKQAKEKGKNRVEIV